MRARILNIFFLLCFFSGFALMFPEDSFSQKNPEVLRKIQELKGKKGLNFHVEWHEDQKRIKTLEGKLSLPFQGTPEEAVVQFLKENVAIFQIRPDLSDLKIEYKKEGLAGYTIRFKQTFNALPVFNGGLGIHLEKDNNSITFVGNNYLPDINVSTYPTLSEKSVIDIAKQRFIQIDCHKKRDKKGNLILCEDSEIILKKEPQVQLGIFAYKGSHYLTYKIFLDIESPRAVVEYVIDANIGDVLEVRDLTQSFDGTGKVFDPNPVNTLNNTGIQDNNDRDSTVFNAAYFTRTLKELYSASGYYYPANQNVFVSDIFEAPYYFSKAKPFPYHIYSNLGVFDFTRKADEFEHVAAFYHIDTNKRYIQSLGFTNVMNYSIEVDPHGLSGADNSHYVQKSAPGTGYLAFGEGGVDDAERR